MSAAAALEPAPLDQALRAAGLMLEARTRLLDSVAGLRAQGHHEQASVLAAEAAHLTGCASSVLTQLSAHVPPTHPTLRRLSGRVLLIPPPGA